MLGPRRRRLAPRSDVGATLIEVLVALSILSVAGVAIMTGLQLTIMTSDIHRKQSVGGANVRNYVEAVQDHVSEGNYDPCDGGVDYAPVTVGFTVPPGYTAGYDEVTALAGDGSEIGCDDDDGVQRIRFTMTSGDGRAREELVTVLRNPCAPGGPPCS